VLFRLWQDSHKSTKGWKVSFWGSIRGKFSANIEMNDLLELFCKIKFTLAVRYTP